MRQPNMQYEYDESEAEVSSSTGNQEVGIDSPGEHENEISPEKYKTKMECENKLECPICWEVLESLQIAHLLDSSEKQTCVHIYHMECISKVIELKCPMCRKVYSKPQLSFPVTLPPAPTVEPTVQPPKPPKASNSNRRRANRPVTAAAAAASNRPRATSRASISTITRSRTRGVSTPASVRSSTNTTQGVTQRRTSRMPSTRSSTTTTTTTTTAAAAAAAAAATTTVATTTVIPSITNASARNLRPTTAPLTTRSSRTIVVSPIIYPLERLTRTARLPQRVNRACLESHLSDEDFVRAFNMDRTTFAMLSKGQQIALRLRHGLYTWSGS